MDGLALHVAWAHIYLAILFSLDMANAPLVIMFSAWRAFRKVRVYLPLAYSIAVNGY
jgi:undecaprenyl-diphosphatase